MQDKKKTKNIKVRDLKPKKDAKGGISTTAPKNVNTPVTASAGRVTAQAGRVTPIPETAARIRLNSRAVVRSRGAVFVCPFRDLHKQSYSKRAAVLPRLGNRKTR